MIELGNLAMLLRDTNALDAEGKIALQMAEDLAPVTEQQHMETLFVTARRKLKWFPRTADLLELYKEQKERVRRLAEENDRRFEREERERLRLDRENFPEKYLSFGEVVRETPAAREHVATLEKRASAAKARPPTPRPPG